MTVLRVFRAGISKANKQFHRPNLQYAAVQRQSVMTLDAKTNKGTPFGMPLSL
jgi:hypothetical protein